MTSVQGSYDAVVVGGGHNGLTAAAYLARAGLSVLVLERLGHPGGAAVSDRVFDGRPARVSRYASLVGLLPAAVVSDLDLGLELASPSIESYAPTLRDGRPGGLLVPRTPGEGAAGSFRELTGGDDDHAAWLRFRADAEELARVVRPTLLGPLPVERDVRGAVDAQVWADFVTRPLGQTIEERFADDTVRGLAASDALAGASVSLHDASLAQNRCFLLHRLGEDPDGWRVPVGGMGAVTDALARAAVKAGAEVVTGAGVSAIRADDDGAEVAWHDGTATRTVRARHVLGNVAPWVLRILLGEGEDPASKPEGSQLVVTLLLDRLPRLRSGVAPETAFAGRLHLGREYSRLEAAYADAAAGRVPSLLPGEVRCLSLTDASVIAEEPRGTHALTFVADHTPASVFDRDPEGAKRLAVERALAALDEHLVEPIGSCLATDAAGRPCVEARTPQDVERELAMPGGHPFHGDLDWPWAPNRARLDTPAQQWGVQTGVASVVVCGAGSRRGGGVSGLGGHSAAHAVLASR